MATQSLASNPNSPRLLAALALFQQTFGKPKTELELQATIGALAAAMDLKDDDLDDLIHQVASYYQLLKHPDTLLETAKQTVLKSTIQKARDRLIETEETLILLISTYLQQVSPKLPATEFVEMAQAAVALLHNEQSKLSFPESKQLLYLALQTFSNRLSKPIPTLGEQIPKRIVPLLARLVQYHKIIRTDGLEAALIPLAVQTLQKTVQRLNPEMIRTALANSRVTLAPELNTQEGLNDLSKALFFKLQFQTLSSRATKSEQETAEQLNQAITEFKTKYQPLTDITKPKWDDDLSVSSSFFIPENFATARDDFTGFPTDSENKSLKDDTNP
ncbi:hypothetical protein [Leptothoe sp. PORK10 BA2]|uniref:hypothetical protein n=1 Tax=Leptothoe sp. PORK10 BA2 TaxID=3110254 RepID=UPI002B21F8E9|nr:hypothetical protein [Leptothoe sp. PORK10 BA2]MEA5465857.1 hypothetical protein [Leptothoe sp. PORK10 BA2]